MSKLIDFVSILNYNVMRGAKKWRKNAKIAEVLLFFTQGTAYAFVRPLADDAGQKRLLWDAMMFATSGIAKLY